MRKPALGTSAVIACLDGADLKEIRSRAYLQRKRGFEGNIVRYSELDDPRRALRVLRDMAPRTMNQEQTIGYAKEIIGTGKVTLDQVRKLQGLIAYWTDFTRYWD